MQVKKELRRGKGGNVGINSDVRSHLHSSNKAFNTFFKHIYRWNRPDLSRQKVPQSWPLPVYSALSKLGPTVINM